MPAPSKDHAAFYFENQDVKAIKVDCLGQCEVNAQPTLYDGVVFYVTVANNELEFTERDVGYNYLAELFHKQYMQGVDKLDEGY